MVGSGIKELFSTVFATNSVDKILTCTAYSRAIRAHILAASAIAELVASTVKSEENFTNHCSITGIKTYDPSRDEPPTSTVKQIIDEKENKIKSLLLNFKDNPPDINSINEDDNCKAMLHLFEMRVRNMVVL